MKLGFVGLLLVGCGSLPEVEDPDPGAVLREEGELSVTRDYERQGVGVELPFDGVYTASSGLRVDFWSHVVYGESSWSAEAVLSFGGKTVVMTHERDMASGRPGMLHFSDKTPGIEVDPAYGLALGELSAELFTRFPENPRGKDALNKEPLGRGIDPTTIGVNKALLREFTRVAGRWTYVGLLNTGGDGGWDIECDDEGGCETTSGGPGNVPKEPPTAAPTPTGSCVAGPNDTLTRIDCSNTCLWDLGTYGGGQVHHPAEHNYVTPATLPVGAHCNVIQNEVCGASDVLYGGTLVHYCAGRCGVLTAASPLPMCLGLLHGRTSWQDCLDADACLVHHELGGSGVGAAGCATLESQAIDDTILAFVKDLSFYYSYALPTGTGWLVDVMFDWQECSIPDPGKNNNPVTPELGKACVCAPPAAGFGEATCDANLTCIYPRLIEGICPHAMCDANVGPLFDGCDTGTPGDQGSCVSQVCSSDAWCCEVMWDGQCVNEATALGCVTCPG